MKSKMLATYKYVLGGWDLKASAMHSFLFVAKVKLSTKHNLWRDRAEKSEDI